MESVPETKYTKADDGKQIAYQVLGDGPVDVVYMGGGTQHVDVQWEHPVMRRFLEGLASFSRLVVFDNRGFGASDPVHLDAMPTWEDWARDLQIVLDAVGSVQAAIFAEMDAGPTAMVFAATQPERTRAWSSPTPGPG